MRAAWRWQRDRRPHRTPGHAWYCDCGSCMADDGRAQRTRLYGCPCRIPASRYPAGYVEHSDPTCPGFGLKAWVEP